jgi:hypothetical protein
LLASVDTRPHEGEPGGQYAVSVADSASAALGKFRYLLFDVQRTESDDEFGNTFYSEIEVVTPAAAAPPAAAPATDKAAAAPAPGDKKYEIVIDYTETPDLKDWVETKLRPTLELWYPKIVQMLPSDGYTCTRKMTVTFQKEGRGVAYTTGGSRIVCAYPWFSKNLEGEGVGAVVHELVHVAQNYGYGRVRGGGGGRNPTWLVEGIADYIRWHKYEPVEKRRKIRPTAKYTDSYHVTGAFLDYVATNVDHEIVVKLNAAMREGRYSPDLWKEYTGKTVDDLWADYAKTLQK